MIDRNRVLTALAVVAGVAVASLALVGQLNGLVLIAAVGLVATAVVRLQRGGHGVDAAWAGAGAGSVALVEAPLVAPTRPVRDSSTTGSVALPLARFEARLLLWSPWFAAGLGFCVLLVAMFGVAFVDDIENSWWATTSLAPLLLHPLCGCTIVAVHRAVNRGRRDGVEELFATCPTGWSTRTRAHLLTARVPLVAGALFLATEFVFIAVRNPRVYGPFDAQAWLPLLAALVLPVGATALGVALARWAPWSIVPFVAVVAVGYADVRIGRIGAPGTASDRWLATGVALPDVDVIWFDTPTWQPLLWLVGLTVVVAGIAIAHDDRSRAVLATIGAGAAVALVGAVLIVQPIPPDRAAQLAETVRDPSGAQTCRAVSELVEVCVFEEYLGLATTVVDDLRPVAAAVPEGVDAPPATFRLLLEDPTEQLPAEIATHLRPLAPTPPEGTLRLGFSSHPEAVKAARMRLGAHLVGLPTEAVTPATPNVVAGEARGVVALWLASRGLDQAAAVDLVTPWIPERDDLPMPATVWPGLCHGEDTVLLWAPQDLDAARQVIDAPEDDVAAVLAAEWARWVNPATTTDDLLEALDLEPVGPADDIPAIGDTCY